MIRLDDRIESIKKMIIDLELDQNEMGKVIEFCDSQIKKLNLFDRKNAEWVDKTFH